MKDSVIVGTFLFFALVVVSSDCRRVKRQDLIPFPRVGKRAWTREGDVTEAGREMATILERVLDQTPFRAVGTEPDSWAASLSAYLQDSKLKGLDTSEDIQTLLGRNTGVASRLSNSASARDIKVPGRVARKRLRTSGDPFQSAGFSSLLVGHLLENIKDKMPDELPNYLQGRLNSQDVSVE